MPRILFTADPKLPRDIAHLGYRKGMEVDLSLDLANRWLRRGVAVVVDSVSALPEPAAEPTVVVVAVDIPHDWQNHHHMARMALARKLTDGIVPNLAAADALIASVAAERAAANPED